MPRRLNPVYGEGRLEQLSLISQSGCLVLCSFGNGRVFCVETWSEGGFVFVMIQHGHRVALGFCDIAGLQRNTDPFLWVPAAQSSTTAQLAGSASAWVSGMLLSFLEKFYRTASCSSISSQRTMKYWEMFPRWNRLKRNDTAWSGLRFQMRKIWNVNRDCY